MLTFQPMRQTGGIAEQSYHSYIQQLASPQPGIMVEDLLTLSTTTHTD